jgi:pimeloyl-ACP methyl ester carboxylesterase
MDQPSGAGDGVAGEGVAGDETAPEIEPRLGSVAVGGGVEFGVRTWLPASGAQASPPFVLLHGIASTSAGWDGVAARLAAAGRAAHALDFRGHGASSRPESGYDLPTFASDLIAALEGLGLEQAVLAGHSLGANVILEAISRRSGLAAGVCFVEGGLIDPRDQFATLEDCLAGMALPPVAGMPLPRLSGYLRQSNPGWSELRVAAALAAFDVHADGTVSWRLTKDRYEAMLRALWAARAADRWPSVQVPALVVAADTGDAAWTASKRAAEARLRGAVPEIRVEWLTADHDVHTDRPDRIAELLLEAFPAA